MFMKKSLIFFILILLTAGFCFGETVMVYIDWNNTSVEAPGNIEQVMSDIEEGIMDSFFEKGHIVTSAGAQELESELPFPIENTPVTIARKGGAGLLLAIRFECNTKNETGEVLPYIANYILTDIRSESIIYKGSFNPYKIKDFNKINQHEFFFKVGQEIANEAIVNNR